MLRRTITAAISLGWALFWATPAGATQFQRVTSDSTHETDPAPSPDGKWLAFASDKSGSYQIWVMPLDGGPARQVTSEPESLAVPDPERPDTTRMIHVRATTPTWAPDSKSLLFISTRTGRYNVYSVPLEGGTPRPLASPIGNNRFAVYSPDGSRIAFYSNRLEPGRMFGFNIYVMDSAGETADAMARQVTRGQGSPGHPSWSPDGRWLAYVSKTVDTTKTVTVGKGMQMKQNALFAKYKAWKSPASGGNAMRLAPESIGGKEFEDTWPSWSPADSHWIAVARRVGSKQDVWILDSATGHGFPLTHSGDAGKPTWTHDGRSIYYTVTKFHPNRQGYEEDIWVATDLTLHPPAPSSRKPSAKRSTGSSRKVAPGGAKSSTAK